MDDLAECLAGGMLGHGEPHWRASHGDFSPWNLRRHGRRMFLFDWEDARWAPAGTDELFFRLTLANARNRSFVARDGEEAAAHFVRVQLQARLALDPHNVSLLRLNRTIVRHDPM